MNEEKKNNWWERAGDTALDVIFSPTKGLAKGIEGVVDAGMGAVGFIGGLFSDDFKRTMRKAIEYDVTGYLVDESDFDDVQENSFMNDNKVGRFIREAEESIGQMAPGLALSFVPGVGPALSMAYTGISAGGNSMEGALKEGAGYNNAFTYGILSGATEAAMEKLGGYAFGDATSLLGKATAGTKFGAWASKGLGKAITGAVSEGVEELGSDFADPVNKWITGVDTEIGANFREALKNIPRTFAMGATVGSVIQGGQVLGQNISNKEAGRGGAKATRADSSLAYVSESAQNYGKNEAQNRKTDKAILQGLTDIGVQMSDMTKEERAVYRESLGEYKNVFNEDGSIKQDLVNADVNNEAISRKLKPISLTLKHAPISSNEQISEGASQAKAHIEKVLGSKANVVITSDSKETNAYFSPDENVFYINNNSATLNDADGAIKKASLQVSFHEMTHSAEGTRQYNEFVKELYRVAKDENAPDAIKKRVGSLFGRELGAIQDYAEQTKGMSKAQARYTFDTEVTADLAGDILADDYIVNKLAKRNAPLVKKLISRFKGTIKKSATVDSESIKYLKKLVSKFEKALDNAQGGVKISQIGNADDEREEKADSSQKSADSKVEDERKSVESSNDGVFQTEFENTVDAILNNTYNSDNIVIMGRTPNILTDIGLSQLPLSITANHIYSIAKTEQEAIAEGRYRQNTNYHGLGAQAVKQIREKLFEPIMVIAHQEFTPPQQAQHVQSKKIVVLVDLQVNGKQVICPIQVDTEVKKGNYRYDVNLIDTYFDKGNVGDLIKEAVAKENIGEIGFYYIDKKKAANLLQGSGYQLPQQLASRLTASNTIIRKIDANVNRKISDFTQSQQFIRFFGDWQNNPAKASKVINDDGTPKVLYHQTNADFYIFDTSIEGAGARDNEMPNGIFLKSTPLDIGLKGKKQMKVYANIRNPLVFADRGEASKYWKQNIDGYKAIIDEIGNNDVKYQEKFDEAFDAVSDDDSKAEAVFEEWENANTVLDKKAKKLINEYLKNNKYDGIILEKDEGSFGRKVQTFIALESTQIKSATDNIGTFDSSNPDIRYSKQRSYEPGKESEFVEKLEIAEQERQESFNQLMSEQLEEMQSLIKDRNESFEQLLSAKYDKVPVTEEFENSEAISIDEADRDRLDSFNQQMSEKLEEVKAFDKKRRELEAQLLKRKDNVPIAENLTQNEAASLESVERDRLESVKQLMNEKLEDFKNLEKQRKELEAQLLGKKENVPVTEEFENNEAASLDSVERERLDSFSQQMQETVETAQSLIDGDQSSIDALVNGKIRGYTRKTDIGKIISDTFEMYAFDDESGDTVPFLAKDAKKEIIASVWKKVNSVKHFSKKKFASLMADKILENTILADSKIYDADKLLKGFMHRIDLSSVADQIGSDIKRKINARWALKEGQTAISIEDIVQQLNTKVGVQISAQDLLGAVTEINSLYEFFKRYISDEAGELLKNKMGEEKYKETKKKIAKDLESAFENLQTENELSSKLAYVIEKSQRELERHREYRKEFKHDEKRARLEYTFHYYVDKMRNIKNHKFSNATQPKFNEYMGIVDLIVKMEHMGNVNLSSVRTLASEIAKWYRKDNALLNYVDEKHTGVYSEEIAEMLKYFVENEAIEGKMLNLFGKFSESQVKSWSNSDRIIVAESENQIENFVKSALKGEISGKKMLIGTLTDDLVRKIKKATNVDLTGFNFELRADELIHIKKQHGNAEKEAKRGQESVDEQEILNVVDVITSFDNVKIGDKPNSLVFEKDINGVYHAVTYYAQGNKSIYPHTLYITKKGGLAQTNNAGKKNLHPVRNAQDDLSTATNNSITKKTQNVNREHELSYSEMRMLTSIIGHLSTIIEKHGKIWRGNRYVEALDVAKEYAKKLNIAEKDVPAFARVLLKNAITRKINDPMSVCASWDGYDEDGFFTQTYREFAEALIKQKHDEMTAFAELKEFERKNKKYFKALINGKSKVKVMGRINVREGKVDTVEMPKYAAIDLYMTSRTGNAIDTFEQTGYKLKLDNEHVEEDFQPISREQIEAMYKEFSEQDKELIKILDKAYNGICRDLKFDTDIRRLGWSNVFEGIYYPLYRDHSVDFDKDDFNSVMSRVSNVASNHTRVHSKNAIIVSNAITKFMRHVNDVTRYANLAIPVENLNILYNLDVGDNARMPTSIKTRLEKSNFWKGADEYLFDLSNDVRGVGKKLSSGKKLIAWLRGSYAKYQLGANPKVWFSQLSSYFASFGELRIGSLLKAFSLKDTYTNSDVDEYCKLAAVRSYERGASSAMAVSEKIGQAGSYLTKPIEFVDRRVVCALFSACQFEAQARYKLEVGSKANKIKAGEILTDVILKTQQNQLVTEQSAVMRDDSEIIRSFTMFSADSMKLNSRFTQSLGELTTINKKLKDAKKANNQQLVEELTKKRNEAIKKTAKYSASIVTIAFYMAALAKAVQWFRRKDEDEPIEEWLFKEAGLNLLTTVPFFRDVVSFFTDGFEADIFAISMVNDVLNATDEMKNNFANMANGKEVTSQQWLSSGRKAVYAIGQLAGFPIRNIYNVVTGWTRRIDQSAGATVDSWFKAPSDTDLKESYKEAKAKGNVSLAGKSLDLIYKNHDMELSDAVLKKELDRLNGLDITKKDDDKSNYSVIAKRAPDTIAFDGEEIELTAKQKNTFKTAYKTAEAEAGKMVRVYRYKKLDSASQSYAIRKIYEYQYSKAEESLIGERARLVYFGDIIGMDKLALILGYANSLKGDKDRKEKITAYIKSMGLISQHASLALRFLGYSDKDNDSKVKNFINARSSLTREQKAELLEMLKLD